jgi:hypothetical protein
MAAFLDARSQLFVAIIAIKYCQRGDFYTVLDEYLECLSMPLAAVECGKHRLGEATISSR